VSRDSSQSHFYKISKRLFHKHSWFAHKEMNFFVSFGDAWNNLVLTFWYLEMKQHRENVQFYLTRAAMSNPNGSLSQKLCHYLNQGRTLNSILLRAAF